MVKLRIPLSDRDETLHARLYSYELEFVPSGVSVVTFSWRTPCRGGLFCDPKWSEIVDHEIDSGSFQACAGVTRDISERYETLLDGSCRLSRHVGNLDFPCNHLPCQGYHYCQSQSCSASSLGGNQVDGLPPAAHLKNNKNNTNTFYLIFFLHGTSVS